MDIEQIKELIKILEDSKLNKLTLKDKDGAEIHLEKASLMQQQFLPPSYAPAPPYGDVSHKEGKVVDQKLSNEQQQGSYITAPLVGTFYTSPSPDQPSFIKEGDEVSEDTIVCIIEAMKVMNEVKAGKKGRIVEICIDNSSPVEFGTKLFKIV